MPDELQPPVARRAHHRREHHGDVFDDPYEWLRDREDPQVLAHLEAENAYADRLTSHLQPLRDTLFGEIKARVKETDVSVPVASGPWWYYSRTVQGQQYAIHARSPLTDPSARPVLDGPDPIADEQILLDGNAAANGHEFFALGALTVSPDHSRVARAIDIVGDERYAVTVADVATGKILDEALTGIGGGCEFSFDGQWIFYTRLDEAWRPFQLWRHRIGTDASTDELLHEEPDERFWMGIGTSRDDRWLLMGLGSRTTSEIHILDASDPTGALRVIAPRVEGVEYDVEPAGDRLLITHNRDQQDFSLAWAPLDATGSDQWQPLLAAGPGERLLGVEAFDDFAVVGLRSGGFTALRILHRDLTSVTGFGEPSEIDFGDTVHSVGLGDNPEPATRRLLLVHESWVSPSALWELDLDSGTRTLLKQQPVLGDFDPNAYAQQRVWATSADGTQVPVSVVHRADVSPDGTHPVLLTAYGAYEVSSDPYFSVARLSLLDRGVVYAVAHARGGGEMGRSWYEGGRYARKVNTFADVVAAGRELVSCGWADPARMALEGGSAGGLMVGAVTNAAPDLFRVVHAQVPFVDALTTILRPDLPLTVGEWDEWGNPLQDKAIYDVMKSYTPYENVAAVPYPTVLATTSLHDTRVYFTEPAKWVAQLRHTVPADPGRPILLRTEMSAGHGGRSGRYAIWEQTAWEWAFILDQLGVGDVSLGDVEVSS